MCLVTKNKKSCYKYAKEDITCYKIMRVIKCFDANLDSGNNLKSCFVTEDGIEINVNDFCVVKKGDENFVYLTPYREEAVLDIVITDKAPMHAKGTCYTHTIKDEKYIHGGYIHTFKEIPYEWFDRFFDTSKQYCVFKCIIPKGTRYVEGIFPNKGVQFQSYASKQLVFLKECKI